MVDYSPPCGQGALKNGHKSATIEASTTTAGSVFASTENRVLFPLNMHVLMHSGTRFCN